MKSMILALCLIATSSVTLAGEGPRYEPSEGGISYTTHHPVNVPNRGAEIDQGGGDALWTISNGRCVQKGSNVNCTRVQIPTNTWEPGQNGQN